MLTLNRIINNILPNFKQNQTDNNNDNQTENLYENITYSNTSAFIPKIDIGKVVKVYDGDTITVASKLPFIDSPIYRFSVRLSGIDTPELKTSNENEKKHAIIARDALSELINGKIVHLQNVSTEKYGRLLADIYIDDIHVNKWMIDQKYGVEYDGGTKQKWDM
jgi:endonuclease YncB( thermonuclease family)